jgi:hypothetical protein
MVVPRRGPGCFEQRKRANNKPPASRRLGSLMLGGPVEAAPRFNMFLSRACRAETLPRGCWAT